MSKDQPMIKGSGIPQVKGVLLRQLKCSWLKELIAKFIGGVLSLGFGLSLGREGPSVQLGANIGAGFSKIFKRINLEQKYLITAGASAGLAAAFNAPLAGVIFALEELHKSFSPLILACSMGACIVADFVSGELLGIKPIFQFNAVQTLPLNYFLFVIVLGIITAVLGKVFNKSLISFQKGFEKLKINDIYKPIIPLLLAGIFGFILPEVLGGGHHLIVELSESDKLLGIIILLFVVKLLFTSIAYGSGVPGGIFLPLLVLGALIGKGYGQIVISLFGLDPAYSMNFMILAMAAYFTAVVRAPITGSILITEMTGSFNHLLPLITISMTAYMVTELIHSKAIYELLLDNLLKNKKGNWTKGKGGDKVVMEIPVSFGSKIEHKLVKEIHWPSDCLMVGIRRGEKEIIPNGNTKIYAGDYIIFISDESMAGHLKMQLLKMGEEVFTRG
jgi:H+/Cl- antiporter ClcA